MRPLSSLMRRVGLGTLLLVTWPAAAQDLEAPPDQAPGEPFAVGPFSPEPVADTQASSAALGSPNRVTFPGGYQLSELPQSDRVEVGGGTPLTLGQVLSSVDRHHPSMESARQRVRAAEGEQLASEGGFDLGLSANGWGSPQGYYDWGRGDVQLRQATPLWGASFYAGWRIGRGAPVPDYYGGYETLDLGEVRAGVRVPLWRDGPIDSTRARIWRAEHTLAAEEASLQGRRLSMRLAATGAYWRWVAAGVRYEIVSRLLNLAEERDDQIATRVRAGAIPPIETLENRRVILARRTSIVSVRRTLEQTAIALSLYLRGNDGAPVVPSPDRLPMALPQHEEFSANLRREVEAAWARRPELERYRALLARQRVSVEYAENRFAPRIDVTLQASADIGSGTDSEQTTLGPAVIEGAVHLSMPFQFREARGGIERSRAQLAGLRADARLVRDRVAAEVQDAYSALAASQQRADLARQAAEAAEAVAAAERRRFELGAAQLFIVNLREQSAASARASQASAEADLQVAHARWGVVRAQGVVPSQGD